MVLIWFSQWLIMWSIFSCAYWLFVYLPWKNIYLNPFSIFKLGCLLLLLTSSLLFIFQSPVPYQIYGLNINIWLKYFLQFFFFFSLHHVACGISVPWPGIEPMTPPMEAWSCNHWSTREVPPILWVSFPFLDIFWGTNVFNLGEVQLLCWFLLSLVLLLSKRTA